MCYGLLQTAPSDLLSSNFSTLTPSSDNTLYLYTSLLQDSACGGGTLTSLRFCYNPYCGNESTSYANDTTATFYVLLLLEVSAGYSVEFVHEERRDKSFCDSESPIPPSSHCCCKRVILDLDVPIMVNSSYALAFVIPEGAKADYTYGVQSMSQGMMLSLPLFEPLPGIGEILEVMRENTSMIPNRLFQLIMEIESGMVQYILSIVFIKNNV